MLHEFLSSNRVELIRRCRAKVVKRDSPPVTAMELDHGVPLFLTQLVEALRVEMANAAPDGRSFKPPVPTTASVEGSRTAALHGQELQAKGYTVGQLVHDYGDLCQAITELAKETDAPITIDEFHTFNRLLDNAIADAVSSFGEHRDRYINSGGNQDLHRQMGTLADEQRKLVETAMNALDALKVGNIGLMGATGVLLGDSLLKLRDLIDQSLPEIRLSSGMTTPRRG